MSGKPKRVVFICTGNTCRSPMAAALLSRRLQEEIRRGRIEVDSAGLYAAKGEPAAEGARKALRAWSLSLDQHRSQPISAALVAKTHLFLTMTAAHRDLLVDLYPQAKGKTFTLAEYAGSPGTDVPDPFGLDDAVYQACAEQLDKLVEKAAQRLVAGEAPLDALTNTARGDNRMIVAVGCDHAGLNLKQILVQHLQTLGVSVVDKGTHTPDSVDYPDFAEAVAKSLLAQEAKLGILVCGTGIGVCISANKVKGIRAALCHDPFSARMARAHNDANVLCLGARVIGPGLALDVAEAFLRTDFEGGRHATRVAKMMALEE